MDRNGSKLTRERIKRANVVNQLALEALRGEAFSPDPQSARKLAGVLKACGDLLEKTAAEPRRNLVISKRVYDVCRRATAVSKIANVLLDNGLDNALHVLEEQLRVQEDEQENLPNSIKEEAEMRSAETAAPTLNQIAMARGYAHDKTSKPEHVRWWPMDIEALIKRIPNSAALIFALGIVSILASVVWDYFTDYDLPKLTLAFGLGLTAAGQWISERAMSDGR